MKKKIKNPKLYARKVRASFQKFLGFYQNATIPNKEKEKMRKQMVKKASDVIKSSDKIIADTFPGNNKNQVSLRLVRLFNKEKEIKREQEIIEMKFHQLMKY